MSRAGSRRLLPAPTRNLSLFLLQSKQVHISGRYSRVDDLQETNWTYRYVPVFLDSRAYVPNVTLKPKRENAQYVQAALNNASEPWPQNDRPMWTLDCSPGDFVPIAVPLEPQSEIIWGIPRGHKAQHLAPFVRFPAGGQPRTSRLTIEMRRTQGGVVITQLYPGEVIEPPPWRTQRTARAAASVRFWQTHGYVETERNILPNTAREDAPPWWSEGRT